MYVSVHKMSKKYTLFGTNVKSKIVGKSNSVFVFKINNLSVRSLYRTLLTVGVMNCIFIHLYSKKLSQLNYINMCFLTSLSRRDHQCLRYLI